jgi:adenosylhomocysteine nucleosidase
MAMSLKVGIVSAMERELGPLLKGWDRGVLKDEGGREFSIWKRGSTTYIQSGIGRNPGIHATRCLLIHVETHIIVSAGFAGALTRELSVGDTITPGTVVDGQTGEVFDFVWGTGVLVSGGSIADEAGKRRLASIHAADAVDMEAASVASVAAQRGVLCCAVKSISDELGFAMPPLNAYVNEDGSVAVERFAAHVVVRPSYWPSLIQLAKNSKRAAVELSKALEHLLRHASTQEEFVNALRELSSSARVMN